LLLLLLLLLGASIRIVQFPGVLLQIKVTAESFTTDAAREWLLVVMCVHVKGQVVDLMEGFVAHYTLVGLLHAVCQFMVLVVAFLMETFSAELADERFETGMDADVRVERRAAIEGLAARLTFVRFLGRVDNLMTAEGRSLSETFAAHLTDERTRTGVNRHVPCQIVMGVENFTTIRARKHAILISRDSRRPRPFDRPFLAAAAVVGNHDVTGW